MTRKHDISLTISIISLVIALMAFTLSFLEYRESNAISFICKIYSRNEIPIKMRQRYEVMNGNGWLAFYIPIWLEFKIVNTGRRPFSVDSILLHTAPAKGVYPQQLQYLNYSLFQPASNIEIPPKTKIMLPIVIEPGHAKIMHSKFDLNINEGLYKEYVNIFKDKEFTIGDIYMLPNEDLRIERNYHLYADVTLLGGAKVKTF